MRLLSRISSYSCAFARHCIPSKLAAPASLRCAPPRAHGEAHGTQVSLVADDLRSVRVVGNGTEGLAARKVGYSHTRNTDGKPLAVSEETCSLLIPMLFDYGFLMLRGASKSDRTRMMQLLIRQLEQRFNCIYLSMEGIQPDTQWEQWFEQKTGRDWLDVYFRGPGLEGGKLTKRQVIVFIDNMEILRTQRARASDSLHYCIRSINEGQFSASEPPVPVLIVGAEMSKTVPNFPGPQDPLDVHDRADDLTQFIYSIHVSNIWRTVDAQVIHIESGSGDTQNSEPSASASSQHQP